MQTRGEHANSTQKAPPDPSWDLLAVRQQGLTTAPLCRQTASTVLVKQMRADTTTSYKKGYTNAHLFSTFFVFLLNLYES